MAVGTQKPIQTIQGVDMPNEFECKIFLKDGSDNDFVVGSELVRMDDEKIFAENSQTFPDYQSARDRYDELASLFPYCDCNDEIEKDLEKAMNDSK